MPEPTWVVRSPRQGLQAIQDPRIAGNFEKALRWRPRARRAVLLPCAAGKPFSTAPSHAQGYLPALAGKPHDRWVVSEPLGVVPYAWERDWPQAHYDFPPRYLRGRAREVLVERIVRWWEVVAPKYERVFLALPAHHRALALEAFELAGRPVALVDVGHGACLESGACPPGHGRASSSRYRTFLRRRVNPYDRLVELERRLYGEGDMDAFRPYVAEATRARRADLVVRAIFDLPLEQEDLEWAASKYWHARGAWDNPAKHGYVLRLPGKAGTRTVYSYVVDEPWRGHPWYWSGDRRKATRYPDRAAALARAVELEAEIGTKLQVQPWRGGEPIRRNPPPPGRPTPEEVRARLAPPPPRPGIPSSFLGWIRNTFTSDEGLVRDWVRVWGARGITSRLEQRGLIERRREPGNWERVRLTSRGARMMETVGLNPPPVPLSPAEAAALRKRIGRKVVQARKLAGLSQRALAEHMRKSPSWVREIERGDQYAPHYLLLALGEAVGKPLGWFYGSPSSSFTVHAGELGPAAIRAGLTNPVRHIRAILWDDGTVSVYEYYGATPLTFPSRAEAERWADRWGYFLVIERSRKLNPLGDEPLRELERRSLLEGPVERARLEELQRLRYVECIHCRGPATHLWEGYGGDPYCRECLIGELEHGHKHVHEEYSDCVAVARRLESDVWDRFVCPSPMPREENPNGHEGRRLTREEWAELVTRLLDEPGFTIVVAAEHYGVSPQAISSHLKTRRPYAHQAYFTRPWARRPREA